METTRVSATWMYTLHNYSDADIDRLKDLKHVSRHLCGREICPSTGTKHLQGRVTFKNNKKWTFNMWKAYDPKISVRVARFSKSDYERKEGDICIEINCEEQGKRTEMDDVWALIKGGADARVIMNANPGAFARYGRGFERMIELQNTMTVEADYSLEACCKFTKLKPLEFSVKKGFSFILIGLPGCGKSQYAMAHFKKPLWVNHMDDLGDFSDKLYDGIIFDDMDFLHLPRTTQIHLVDWAQPRNIHIRYKVAKIPKHTPKIFTCNDMCMDIDDEAILRRVTVTKVTRG